MELIACTCPVGYGLPHDHLVGPSAGRELPHYDPDDVGHLWVDWKKFGRSVLEDQHAQMLTKVNPHASSA